MKKLLRLTSLSLLAGAAVHAQEAPVPATARLRAVEKADRQFLAIIDQREAVPVPPVKTASPVPKTSAQRPAVAKVKTPTRKPSPQKRPVTTPSIPKAVAVTRAPVDDRSKRVRSSPALDVALRPDRLVKITTTTVTTRIVRADHDEEDD